MAKQPYNIYSVTWYLCQEAEGDLESEPYRGEQHGMSQKDALKLVNSIINDNWLCVYQDEGLNSFLYKLEDKLGHMVGVVKMSPKKSLLLDSQESL